MKGFRLPEWVKNLLIVLLSCSALYLFTLTPLYLNSPLRDWTAQLLDRGQSETANPLSLAAVLQPARIAIRNVSGCYGVQYDVAAADDAYAQTSALLETALSSAQAPQLVAEDRWRQALTGSGIYFDFCGDVPLSALVSGESAAADSLTASARKLLLALEEDHVFLYYQDSGSGLFYVCTTTLNGSDHLLPIVESFTPNGAFFAFEDARYQRCDPYTLISSSVPSPQEYTVSVPLNTEDTDTLGQVLAALSFSGPSVNSYQLGTDTIYRSNEDTLQLTGDGVLIYQGNSNARYPTVSEDETLTLKNAIETSRSLTAPTLEALCGGARLYLLSAVQSGATITVTYGYSLDGAGVWLDELGWAAQFVFTGGVLTDFTLRFRTYTATGTTTLVLPPLLASAAMTALDKEQGELLLSYRDTEGAGSTIAAGWIAN